MKGEELHGTPFEICRPRARPLFMPSMATGAAHLRPAISARQTHLAEFSCSRTMTSRSAQTTFTNSFRHASCVAMIV